MSFVWKYFKKTEADPNIAACQVKTCKSKLSCKGSSTSGMIKHLKIQHKIVDASETEDTEIEEPPKKKLKQSQLLLESTKPSRSEIISQLVAEDGFTIEQIRKSSFFVLE